MKKSVIIKVNKEDTKQICLPVDSVELDNEAVQIHLEKCTPFLLALCCRVDLDFEKDENGGLFINFGWEQLKAVTNVEE